MKPRFNEGSITIKFSRIGLKLLAFAMLLYVCGYLANKGPLFILQLKNA